MYIIPAVLGVGLIGATVAYTVGKAHAAKMLAAGSASLSGAGGTAVEATSVAVEDVAVAEMGGADASIESSTA